MRFITCISAAALSALFADSPYPAESARNPAREGRGDRIRDVHFGRRVSKATPRHPRKDKSSRASSKTLKLFNFR